MNRRQRILFLVRPMRGGMRQHLLALATLLPRDAFSLEAAGPPGDTLLPELEQAGIRVHPLPISASLNPWHDLSATGRLLRILRSGHYDLIHAHGFKASVPGRLAALIAGRLPVVYTVHNFVATLDKQRLYRTAYLTAERTLAPVTARYIAVSRALGESLAADAGIGADRISVIHNGIDLTRFPALPGSPASPPKPFILCVARLVPEKGLDVLIGAAALLAESGRSPEIRIVGDGPLRGELESLTKSKGLSGRVQLLGYREDVLQLYREAAAVVFPSRAEGLSISLLEAMASGRPVVITRTGGMVELVEDGVSGLIVPPGDATGLARAIDRLLSDDGLAAGLGRKAREVAENHSVEVMVRQTRDVYLEVLASSQTAYGGAGHSRRNSFRDSTPQFHSSHAALRRHGSPNYPDHGGGRWHLRPRRRGDDDHRETPGGGNPPWRGQP